MSLKYKHRLITHLAHSSYTPAPVEILARDLRVPSAEFPAFHEAVKELAAKNEVVIAKDHTVRLPDIGEVVIGTFRKNPKGFGFIQSMRPNSNGDLFVPIGSTLDALSGDLVKADVVYSPRRGDDDRSPYTGVITEVIERKRTTFTGELGKKAGQWLVFPDGKVVTEPVLIRDATSKNAREGDKVAFEITTHAEGGRLAEGVITKVLGESGRPDVETAGVIEAFNLPTPGEFPEECVEQARQAAMRYDAEIREADAPSPSSGGKPKGFDPDERLDLRNEYIITIDPPDAKDYDDAISIERVDRPGGGSLWRLGVHIADVAHFIEPDSPLDKEARERANSCYLPRLVIPMLPENLSNGICSLQEGVPRYCKTAWIDYDENGVVRAEGFANTIIKSTKRLTYIEAQALLDGDQELAKQHAKTEPIYTDKLIQTLHAMDKLSKKIRERRRRNGMIHLDLPDVELEFDPQTGKVCDAHPEDQSYTHTLIEMFMVEANEAVARLFENLGVPLLRRIHPEPVPGASETLNEIVKVAGYRIPKSPTREDLQAILDATKGTAAAPAIHMAVLRTLTRAEYSPALVGHFALASEAYAHFTSPIRRYADLTVHRALAEFLGQTANGRTRPARDDDKANRDLGRALKDSPMCPDEQELVLIGQNCNYREENATEAERELRQFLVLQLLQEHIGEAFAGICTGVSPNGVFVRLDKYLVEGMVKSEDLPIPDAQGKGLGKRGLWALDRKSGALVERNSGRSYAMGDRLDVTVAAVDLARRKMDLFITDPNSRAAGKPKKLASLLKIGELDEGAGGGLEHTGADKRAARSKSRERNKSDFRQDRKNKGKGKW